MPSPFPEYPRPLLQRQNWTSFNGFWDFDVREDDLPPAYTQTILVPYPPQSALSGYGKRTPPGARLYYRRFFESDGARTGEKTLLHFGACDRRAEVFLNGTLLCVHEDGYLPFSADLTPALLRGVNELTVRVRDDASPLYPYGKQREKRGGMWYTPVSGLWQSVFLETVPAHAIEEIRTRTVDGRIEIAVRGGEKEKTLRIETSGETRSFSGDTVTLDASRYPLWSAENPQLCYFTIESGKDRVRSYFAVRTVQTRGNEIRINGRKTFFHALLDQGYHPGGIFLPESEEDWVRDLQRLKSLGFNTLRKHIKLEPQRFYYLCDRLGVYVFQDFVNNGRYRFFSDTLLPTLGFRRRRVEKRKPGDPRQEAFFACAEGVQDALFSHPSVVLYTVFNEGWGQFGTEEAYARLKARDESRLYDAASGWFRSDESDVVSLHVYFRKCRLPRGKMQKPVLFSEFGGYSYPVPGHRFTEKKNYGYAVYRSRKSFSQALTRLYETQILPAARRGLAGCVYTQLSDVEEETNGLVTYDRQVLKVDAEKLYGISAALYAAAQESAREDPGQAEN